MLSIQTLKSSGEASKYYQNYYTGKNAPPSEWLGKGAKALDLFNEVEETKFKNLLEGNLPNGQTLGKIEGGQRHFRPGYDLTFSAPKSVSIMGLVAGDERVIEAHQNAVKEVVQYLEKNYASTRLKQNGEIKITPTQNLVVAAFQHVESRELDPQLHTHCVILNMTEFEGKWRTLYGDDFFTDKKLLGMIYRSHLACELAELGYGIETLDKECLFEIAGVPNSVMEHFSKRRHQIEVYLSEHEYQGGKAAQVANRVTRAIKKDQLSFDELKATWQQDLNLKCHDAKSLKNNCEREVRSLAINSPEIQADTAVKAALLHLSSQKSVFTEKEVLTIAKGLSIAPPQMHYYTHALQTKLKSSEALWLGDGKITTQAARDLELENLILVKTGRNACEAITWQGVANSYGAIMLKTPAQRQALTTLLTHKDRHIAIDAFTGSGYDKVIKNYQRFATASHQCLTLTPNELDPTQQNVLKAQYGTHRNYKLQSFIQYWQKQEVNGNLPNSKSNQHVWILDKSHQLSTREANQVLHWAQKLNARVVWVGDRFHNLKHHQGAAFEVLTQKGLRSIHLTEKEQTNTMPILSHHTVHEIKDRVHFINQAASLATHQNVLDPLPIVATPTQAQCTLMNNAIREQLKAKGLLTKSQIAAPVLQRVTLSSIQKKHLAQYQLNDILHFNRNVGNITSGTYAQVESINKENNSLILHVEGKQVEWQVGQSQAQHVEIYRAQQRDIAVGEHLILNRKMKLDRVYAAGTQMKVTNVEGNKLIGQIEKQTITLDLNNQSHQHFDYAYTTTLQANERMERKVDFVLLNVESQNLSPLIIEQASKQLSKDGKIITNNQQSLGSCLAGERQFFSALDYRVKPFKQFDKLDNAKVVFEGMHASLPLEARSLINFSAISNESCTSRYKQHTWEQAIIAIDQACLKISEREACFSAKTVITEALKISRNKVPYKTLERAFKHAEQQGYTIKLKENKNLYSTQEIVHLEKKSIELMQQGQGAVAAIMAHQHPSLEAVRAHNKLTDGQKAAIEFVLTSPDRIIGIQGVAGSGKTSMLKEVKRLANDAGFDILGVTNTNSAKLQMHKELKDKETSALKHAGIETLTLRRFLNHADKLMRQDMALAKQTYGDNKIIILDESSFASVRDVYALASIASTLNTKLVMLGDVKQHPSIEASRPFYLLLANDMPHQVMKEVVRLKDPFALEVVQELYANRVHQALDKMSTNIEEIPDSEERLARVADLYLAFSNQAPDETIAITLSNKDRMAINERIRERLKAKQALTGDALNVTILIPKKELTKIDKTDTFAYETGDVIRFNQGDSRLGIQAGQYATITTIDHKEHQLGLKLDSGIKIIWSPKTLGSNLRLLEIYQSAQREIMKGDAIIWSQNDEKRGTINGEKATILSVNPQENNMQVALKNGNTLVLDLHEKKNMHFDYSYTVTSYLAQGATIKYVIMHANSSFPISKKTAQLQINDEVCIPKLFQQQEKNYTINSIIATLQKQTQQTLEFKDRQGNMHIVNKSIQENWQVYPDPYQIDPRKFTKNSLNAFLVNASRGDVTIAVVDNQSHYQKSIEVNRNIKLSAFEKQHQNWQQLAQKVEEMTAHVVGIAKPTELKQSKEVEQLKAAPPLNNQTNIPTDKSLKYINKEALIEHLHRDILGFAKSYLGEPQYKPHGYSREVAWGKKGSMTVCLHGAKAGYWFDFERGVGGKDMFSFYMDQTGNSFKEALESLSQDYRPHSAPYQLRQNQPTDSAIAIQKHNSEKTQKAYKVYQAAKPIKDTLAEVYLTKHRKIDTEFPKDFRFHPGIWHKDLKQKYPALLAPIYDQDGKFKAVVRIFLNQKGNKLNKKIEDKLINAKLNLGPSSKGFVKIQKQNSNKVFLAEGIETALSVAQAMPKNSVYAALSVYNLKNLKLDSKKQELVICADKDGPNTASNSSLVKAVEEYLKQGIKISVAFPQSPFKGQKIDFNDELKRHGSNDVKSALNRAIEIKSGKHLTQEMNKMYTQNTQKMLNNSDQKHIKIESERSI